MILNPIVIKKGGVSVSDAPPTPADVYNATRPSDWLTMPTPEDNEMYLLFHIPDGYSSLLAFVVTCTGNYTVAIGTVSNGAFVQASSASVASGSKYEAELFADDYGNLTSDGMKQCMVKISGSGILTWAPKPHTKKTAPRSFASWNIREIMCKLPSATSIICGGSNAFQALKKLKYFTCLGSNAIKSMNNMFFACSSLMTILELDSSKVTNFSGIFQNCPSLVTIPRLDTSKATNFVSFFNGCSSLVYVPEINTANATNMSGMFQGCVSLKSVPALNTSKVQTMNGMFQNCQSLKELPMMDTALVTSMGGMFQNSPSLVTIPPLDTHNVTTMNNLFYNCNSLKSVPALDTSKVKNMNYMFQNCSALSEIQALDTSNVTTMMSMFQGCNALTRIPKLNTGKATNMGNVFTNALTLESVLFDSTVSGWAGYAISLANCSLSHDAIVAFFNSLPTITDAKAITLTGNPGVSELTDAEKAIATGKGWTLTL